MKRCLLFVLLFCGCVSAQTITISGGAFQDSAGNKLALGTLTIQLTADAQISTSQIVAGPLITIQLDSNANAPNTVIQSNANITPAGTGYIANVYSASGIPGWLRPQIWVFSQSSGSVDLGTMVPTAPGGPSYSGAAILAQNNAFTGNNTHAGTETFNGPVVETVTNALSNAGSFSTGQMNEYVTSLINGCNPLAEYQIPSGNNAWETEANTACITTASSITGGGFLQSVAYAAYAINQSTTIPTIGFQAIVRSTVSNSSVHGASFVAMDGGTGVPNNNYYGTENYMVVGSGNTTSAPVANLCNGNFLAQPTTAICFDVTAPAGGGKFWPWGFRCETAATPQTSGTGACFLFNPVAAGTNQPSQGILMVAGDPSSGTNTTILQTIANGSFQIGMSKATAAVQMPRVMVLGTAPTCAFTSGGGTSPACTVDTGSTDTAGIIIATTGTGSPAGTGTITLTFSAALGTNKPVCLYQASDGGAASWSGLAVMKDKTPSTSSDLFTWTNGTSPTALSTSTAYWINYQCWGK